MHDKPLFDDGRKKCAEVERILRCNAYRIRPKRKQHHMTLCITLLSKDSRSIYHSHTLPCLADEGFCKPTLLTPFTIV